MKRIIFLPFALLLASAAQAQPANGDLTVTFDVSGTKGAVLAALYDTQAAYDGSGTGTPQMGEATGDRVTLRFAGLKPGTYAIKAFHDLNGDGQLNMNPFGMPTEPFAFSNNAVVRMGPPAWSEAAFEVRAGANAQSITLR